MNILVIDDDLIMHKVLNHTLTSLGHKIVTATNGQKALDYLKLERDVDVIICDIMMPVVSGVTFMSLFNQHPFKNTPIIVISALKDGEEFLKKHNIVFNHFIEKPFGISYLKHIVKGFNK